MSLLQQIVEEAISKDSSVTRLLRLCMVLAHDLRHEPLSTWIKHELEGYPDDVSVPPYRIFVGTIKGNMIGRLEGVVQLSAAVLPEDIRKAFEDIQYRRPVAECAQMVEASEGKGTFKRDWPIALAIQYGSAMTPGSHCTGAWMELPIAHLTSLIDQIKTKILAFSLEIKSTYPDAGLVPAHDENLREKEKIVSQIFNTTINGGNVSGVAFGNHSVEQSIVNGIKPGDLPSLIAALEKIGLSKETAAELANNADVDRISGEKGIGSRVKAWFEKTKDAAVDIAADKTIEQIITYATAAILAFAP